MYSAPHGSFWEDGQYWSKYCIYLYLYMEYGPAEIWILYVFFY